MIDKLKQLEDENTHLRARNVELQKEVDRLKENAEDFLQGIYAFRHFLKADVFLRKRIVDEIPKLYAKKVKGTKLEEGAEERIKSSPIYRLYLANINLDSATHEYLQRVLLSACEENLRRW